MIKRWSMGFVFFSAVIFFHYLCADPLMGAPHERVLRLPHELHTLPNGLNVVLVRYPSPGVVAYQIPVRVGSRNEVELGKTGFAHFFEHLMFRGTRKMTADQFRALYNRLGCENNAWTSDDITNYHGVVAKAYLPQILEAEADRFQNLYFDEKALKDEAGAVLGEYNKNVAQPEFLLEEALAQTAFQVHTYGHTTMGYRQDIEKYTERYQDVWPFFKRHYRPGATTIVLVGDVDFKTHLALIKKYFSSWKEEKVDSVVVPPEPEQTAQREKSITIPVPTQTRVVVAYKTPAFNTQNLHQAIMDIISEAYFSVTSNFQKKYLFQEKWLDQVSANATESMDPGLFRIHLRFSELGESHIQQVEQALDSLMQSIGEIPLSQEQLQVVKNRLKNIAQISWFGSPQALASRIAWYVTFERDMGVLDRIFDNIEKVTAAQIKYFAKVYLIPRNRTIITLKGSGS